MSIKAWERQRGESQKAFEAFTVYRDLESERSLVKVGQKLGKSSTLIERWSVQWSWVERARLYDEEKERQYLLQQEEERKKMAERHAKQSMMFQNKVLERLRTIDPNRLTPADLIKWFEVAVKVERQARGESTEKHELNHTGQVNTNNEHNITHRVLHDPVTRELARELFRRSTESDLGS